MNLKGWVNYKQDKGWQEVYIQGNKTLLKSQQMQYPWETPVVQ